MCLLVWYPMLKYRDVIVTILKYYDIKSVHLMLRDKRRKEAMIFVSLRERGWPTSLFLKGLALVILPAMSGRSFPVTSVPGRGTLVPSGIAALQTRPSSPLCGAAHF